MGSLMGSAAAIGDANNLFTVLLGLDGLVGAFFGSVGDLIGVGGGA